MFDIGFWELCLVAIVALIVLGPEKLPGAARTAGLWVARARRLVNEMRADIEGEFKLEELNRMRAGYRRSQRRNKHQGVPACPSVQPEATPDEQGTEATQARAEDGATKADPR